MMLRETTNEELTRYLEEQMQVYNLSSEEFFKLFPSLKNTSSEKERRKLPNNYATAINGLVSSRFTFSEAIEFLSKNFVGVEETLSICNDSRRVLSSEYGLEIPDHLVHFDKKFNVGPDNFSRAKAHVINVVTLPEIAGFEIIEYVAHEQGHIYHFANSEFYRIVKSDLKKGQNKEYATAEKLIEGFASFISMLYAKALDKKYGLTFGFEELFEQSALFKKRHYLDGLKIFQRIEERDGIEGVLYAANTFTSDVELENFYYGN